MNEKWEAMSKAEKFFLILGFMTLVHLIIERDLIIAGIEILVIAVIFIIYISLKKDGLIRTFVKQVEEESQKAIEARRQELEKEINQLDVSNDQSNDNVGDQNIAKYNETIRLNPDDSSAYFERASAYSKKGHTKQAIVDFTKAIELKYEPSSIIYTNRGNCYAALGEHEKAIEDYNKAIKFDQDYALAYYNRAHAYKEIGNKDQALADIAKALELVKEPALEQAFRAQLAYWE